MEDWVEKIRESLDLKRATSLKVQVNTYQLLTAFIVPFFRNL